MKTKLAIACALGAMLPLRLLAAEPKPLPKELPPFGPDRPLPPAPITEIKTAEGLTVWVVARSGFPKVRALLTVRGGTAADPRDLPGLSDLLARTVKEGTPTRSAQQIAEQLQALGGEIHTQATEDAIFVAADGLATGIAPLLDVLADVARHAAFAAAEVELAKTTALGDLQERMAEPFFPGEKAFAAALYGDHPYHVTAPTAASISATTPAILRREFARRFRPERALLIVIGDLDPRAAERQITAAFGGWQAAGEPAPQTPPAPTAVTPVIELVNRPNSVQSLILVGSPAPRQGDADYYPLLVANTIFGGSFASRLVTNIREDKGYTYSPGADITAHAAGAFLRARAEVRNEVTAATLNEIFYELGRMATTSPSDAEMTNAKRYQNGLYLIQNQVQRAVARLLAANWINGIPAPRELGNFIAKVNAVTVSDVDRVSKADLPARRQLVVVVGDAARVRGDLQLFGPVTDITP
jgi:zinc protease